MKKIKLIYLLAIVVTTTSCNVDNELPEIVDQTKTAEVINLNSGSADFSKYIAVGTSFTAGVTDGTLFKASQENSFPNILASKFVLVGGGNFNQPLIEDNIGGLLYGGIQIQEPRFYFNGSGPVHIDALPTTETTTKLTGEYNNYGIPGAKSFHLIAPGYGSVANVPTQLSNPYYARFSSSETADILTDVFAKSPTFFTLSGIGNNDILGYALSGGTGKDQTGNNIATSYGSTDITDPELFNTVLKNMVNALTENEAKGVIVNIPYITSLANFTTIPYNPLDPTEKDDDGNLTEVATELASQIPTLNALFGNLNLIFEATGETKRIIKFTTNDTNPIIIIDESLTDMSTTITSALTNNANFTTFVEGFGLPAAAAPSVAILLGSIYGQTRQATNDDLLLLASKNVIGETDTPTENFLESQGLPEALAAQFSVEGLTKPLEDQWVLISDEQEAIRVATDAYNTSIEAVTNSNDNLVMLNLNSLLTEATTSGIQFDNYNLNTSLVSGGLISLDGIHLTSRGYALMANKILEVIDNGFGSNFTKATNGLVKADDYPTNYSSTFR